MSSATPADVIGSLVTAAAPAVSPDGARVVFVVRRVDLDANQYRSQLWLASSDGSAAPRPLTAGTATDADPAWSPAGDALAFSSTRGGEKETTVHVLRMDGPGETTTLAARNEAITHLSWSPDGRWLAFASRCRDARYDETDPAKQPPRKITRFLHRLDGAGWTYDRPFHVYIVPADGTAAPLDLTPGESSFEQLSWLADSSGLVVSGPGHDNWDRDLAIDLYRVKLDGAREALTEHTGQYLFPSVSPTGREVAFVGFDDPLTYPQNVKVGVLDLETRSRRWVSETLDRTFLPSAGGQGPVWTEEGLLATAEDRGDARLYRLDPTGRVPPVPVTTTDQVVTEFDAAAGTLVCSVTTVDRPAELHVASLGAVAPVRVTALSDRFVARIGPRTAERFVSPSTSGVEVDSWVMTPPGFDPSQRYPVLLNVHGGPFTQYGNGFFDEAQIQAAAGYLVVMANPRGSSGRETSWGQAIMGPTHAVAPGTGWGTVDVEDVLAVLDEALRRYPAADPDRVGMLGGSYGGYVATWLAAHHGERFRAICSERAVNNLLSEEWNSDIATMFRVEHGATHLARPEEYLRMSPITYVDRITTPMLIIHAEDDLRCPVTQAEELFVALRMLGREVEFVRFPAEGHELSRSGSPRHRVQRADLILDFFARHLHG